jgi:hypothetical protein
LSELELYLRGRALNEISSLVESHLLENGVTRESLLKARDPLDGAKKALDGLRCGDLVLLFVLDKREQVESYISSLGLH